MNRTKIEWCDWTWNPIVGCSPVSAGCANCYAAALACRFGLPWGAARFLPERLGQPALVRKPGRVFVCSMGDIGHDTVAPEWRKAVCDAMRAAPWHTFLILTKRPGAWLRCIPPPVWVGVTVESRETFNRWRMLCACAHPEALKFVSVEPMLGPVSFRAGGPAAPDWVIAGPETGPKARRCDPAWIDGLDSESPCFFDKRKRGWTRREFPRSKGLEW